MPVIPIFIFNNSTAGVPLKHIPGHNPSRQGRKPPSSLSFAWERSSQILQGWTGGV